MHSELGREPTNGEVFIFINRRRTHIKLLHWQSGGFVLLYKRLEKGTFPLPQMSPDQTRVSWPDLVLMIEGIRVERGIPGPGLLTSILIDKYCDHLPLYRQLQRFKRLGVPIAYSTLQVWTRQGLEKLQVLYDHLVADTIGQGYLQVDETPIKVLESQKKDSCHLGYYWVYHSPLSRTVLFDYQPSRSRDGPAAMLADFKGNLQTDGYGAYEKIGAGKQVKHLGCWAHVRRRFVDAMTNDPSRAEYALLCIQRLYAVEWISNLQNQG